MEDRELFQCGATWWSGREIENMLGVYAWGRGDGREVQNALHLPHGWVAWAGGVETLV
jgi:hypothetical protein